MSVCTLCELPSEFIKLITGHFLGAPSNTARGEEEQRRKDFIAALPHKGTMPHNYMRSEDSRKDDNIY